MTRPVWSVLSMLAATCVALACGDPIGPGGRGDPDAPVELWSLPPAGRMDVRVPFALAGASGAEGSLDAGMPAAGPPGVDQLDPDEVYMFQTQHEGTCDRHAIAPVLAPAQLLVGFDCLTSAYGAFVRPTDGRMLYPHNGSTGELRAFHCDGCAYATDLDDYPLDPLANDPIEPTPGCSSSGFIGAFVVSVDGALVYQCTDGWYGADGAEIMGLNAGSPIVLSVGRGGTLLLTAGIVDLTTGAFTPFAGLTSPTVLASRAREDGYWIAIRVGDSVSKQAELWHVAFDAMATLVGAYPEPPSTTLSFSASALDGQGRLLVVARDLGSDTRETIVRRSLDGESAVIYDEAEGPVPELDVSDLFTGP